MSDILTEFNTTCELMRPQSGLDASGFPKESNFYVTDDRIPCRVIVNSGSEGQVYNAERNTTRGVAYLPPGVTVDGTYRIRWQGRLLDITAATPKYSDFGQLAFYKCDWEERRGVG